MVNPNIENLIIFTSSPRISRFHANLDFYMTIWKIRIEDGAKIDNPLQHFYINLLQCPETVNLSGWDY